MGHCVIPNGVFSQLATLIFMTTELEQQITFMQFAKQILHTNVNLRYRSYV